MNIYLPYKNMGDGLNLKEKRRTRKTRKIKKEAELRNKNMKLN